MNVSWLKKHAMIVAFVAAFLVVLGVVVWLQQQASGKKAEIDAALTEQMSELNHLLQTKPAPAKAEPPSASSAPAKAAIGTAIRPQNE